MPANDCSKSQSRGAPDEKQALQQEGKCRDASPSASCPSPDHASIRQRPASLGKRTRRSAIRRRRGKRRCSPARDDAASDAAAADAVAVSSFGSLEWLQHCWLMRKRQQQKKLLPMRLVASCAEACRLQCAEDGLSQRAELRRLTVTVRGERERESCNRRTEEEAAVSPASKRAASKCTLRARTHSKQLFTAGCTLQGEVFAMRVRVRSDRRTKLQRMAARARRSGAQRHTAHVRACIAPFYRIIRFAWNAASSSSPSPFCWFAF